MEITDVHINKEHTLEISVISESTNPPKGKHLFGVEYSYAITSPEPNPESPLVLTASKSESESLQKVSVTILNKDTEMKGMLMCILGIQTGFKINLNDLEGLRLKSIIDFYEMRKENSEVILYWRGVDAEASRTVDLVLLREFKVENPSPMLVTSYLYYDKEGSIISQLL